jgi:hypothetical protein
MRTKMQSAQPKQKMPSFIQQKNPTNANNVRVANLPTQLERHKNMGSSDVGQWSVAGINKPSQYDPIMNWRGNRK